MDVDSPKLNAYLFKLNEMTQGDPAAQVSMYEVGEALGIESDEAGQMAETLFIGGQAELKTLSGGIGITSMGMEALGVKPPPGPVGVNPGLGTDRVLSDQDRENIKTVLLDIKSGMGAKSPEYKILETVVMDIKTIEVQMLSPAPKTAVVREVLRSIGQTLPASDISDRVAAMVKKG